MVNGLQKATEDQIWSMRAGDLHAGGEVGGNTSKVSNYTLKVVF